MKPIKLVLSAYGPFPEKAVIDFEKLGSDGVFLISGPTGSGKTTIFDGICYALYGTASGNLRTPKMMRSTYAEPDVKTFVELTFSSHGKEYRINRRPEQEVNKVSGSGTTVRSSEVSLEILDGGSTVYTGKREVEEKIKEIIGLDANQFRQVTMIAQGEFLKVLNSTTEERMEIFSKVFKTGRYTLLQEELKLAVKEVSEEVAKIEEGLKREFNLVFTPDFIDQQNISVDVDGLSYEEKQSMLEKIHAETEEKKSEIVGLKEKLTEEKDESIKNLTSLDSVLQHFLKLNEISRRLDVLGKEKNTIAEEQKAIPKLKSQTEDIISAISKLEALRPHYQKLENEGEKLAEQLENLKSYEKQIEKIDKVHKENEESLDNDRTSLQDLELESKDSDEINAKLNARLDFQGSISNALTLISKIDDIKVKYDKLAQEVSDDQINYIKLKEEYNNMDILFLKQQAGILARDLEDGVPCPVCGSTSHPMPAKTSNIMYEKEDLDQKKKELEAAEGIFNKSKQEAALNRGNLESLKQEGVRVSKMLQDSYDKQNTSFHSEIETALQILKENQIESGNQLEQIFQMDSELSDQPELFKKIYSKIREVVDVDIRKLESKQSDILKAKDKIKSLKQNIEELEAKLKNISDDGSEKRAEYNRIQGEYRASKSTYENEIKELEYEDIDRLDSEIEKQRTILTSNKEKTAEIEKRVENYFVEYNDLKSQNQTLSSLVQGKDEGTVRQAYEEYSREIDDLKMRINTVDSEQTEIVSLLKNISSALDVYEKFLPELEEKKNLFDQYLNLSATCSGELPGKSKIKLETFVQMSFLDRILNRANIRFLKMSEGRYMLTRDDEGDNKRSQTGLDLSVHDLSNNTYRSTKSLSGGESFQASLCLALGFADEIQHSAGGIQIETMFIDEGFGTLDNVALKNAVDSLVDLSKGNKLVGIISHVDELRERIDRGISIEKSSFKGSKLTIQG